MTRKTSMQEDEVAGCGDNVVFVPQRRRQRFDEIEQPIPTSRNMGAVLNVVRRPETLRFSIIALIEERVEGIQNNLYVAFLGRRAHRCDSTAGVRTRSTNLTSAWQGRYVVDATI